jgi:hypothetical protein
MIAALPLASFAEISPLLNEMENCGMSAAFIQGIQKSFAAISKITQDQL